MADERVHNVAPDNGADKNPKAWENADDKDPRGIRKVWETGKRLEKRKVDQPAENDTAAFADTAAGADKRLKKRKVSAAVKDDQERRGFPAYAEKDEEGA